MNDLHFNTLYVIIHPPTAVEKMNFVMMNLMEKIPMDNPMIDE